MRQDLILIGAGGHAKVAAAAAIAAGHRVVAAYDDDPGKVGARILGVPVLGAMAGAKRQGLPAVMGIGGNALRARIAGELDLEWAVVVHPTAWVHESVQLGAGTVVFAGAVIQPDTVLGAHVIVNTGATVDHDCHLGDFVHVAPGSHLAGGVRLGQGAFLGVGVSAIPGRSVGAWTVVGAGAAIVRDLPDRVTAVGVPARIARKHG